MVRDAVEVTAAQIGQIQNISGFFNNFRDTQSLNGRTVDHGSIDWSYPYDATEWGEVSAICEDGFSQSPIDLPKHGGLTQDELNVTSGSSSKLNVSHEHSLK